MLSYCTLLLRQAEGLTGRQEQAHELQQSKTLHDVVLMPAPMLSITENLDKQAMVQAVSRRLAQEALQITLRIFIHRSGNAHTSTA